MSEIHDVNAVVLNTTGTLEAINRAEIDIQIATAKRYPRSIERFRNRALSMVTMDEDVAESCIYRRPVGKKYNKDTGRSEMTFAEGMSVRLAEIVAASYENIRGGSFIVEQNERFVVARGFCHDLETNVAQTSECIESTVKKDGTPYDERMRVVVAKAALAKARRDATFMVVPRALCKPLENEARRVAIGDQQTIARRIERVLAWVNKIGIDVKRVWQTLGIKGPADIDIEILTTLTGLKTAIKDGDITIDEAFPDSAQDRADRAKDKIEGIKDRLKADPSAGVGRPHTESATKDKDQGATPGRDPDYSRKQAEMDIRILMTKVGRNKFHKYVREVLSYDPSELGVMAMQSIAGDSDFVEKAENYWQEQKASEFSEDEKLLIQFEELCETWKGVIGPYLRSAYDCSMDDYRGDAKALQNLMADKDLEAKLKKHAREMSDTSGT